MKERILLPVLFIILVAPLLYAQSDEGPPGPLRVRDMMPLSILSMGFTPSSAATLKMGKWGVEVHLCYANTFIMSSNVKAYLRDNNHKGDLTNEDFSNLLALPGDAFYFDGEIGLLLTGIHYGLTENLQAGILIPTYSFTGGHLDNLIYDFHDTLGIDQAGRDLVASDNIQVLLKMGGSAYTLPDAPSDGGVGDPTFTIRYHFPRPLFGWDVALTGAAKIPMMNAERYLSSGHSDYGVQITFQRCVSRHGLYADFSWVKIGDIAVIPAFNPNDIPSATLAWTYRLSPAWTSVLQGTWSKSIFHDETPTELGDPEYQVSAGFRHRRGKVLTSFAFTENIINFENTPDIGFHISLCVLLQ